MTNILETILTELAREPEDYAAAKEQARRIDSWLGYRCEEIENFLHAPERSSEQQRQFWNGLDVQSMQTPYSEIMAMLRVLDPQPGEHWLDLGAAYGRMGIVLGLLRPEVQFTGFEIVPERVNEGNRIYTQWGIAKAKLSHEDLACSDFPLGQADLYFIYDFGSKEDIDRVFAKLAAIARVKPIQVVGRGRGIRNWIAMEQPWLGEINPPQHFGHWSLYQS